MLTAAAAVVAACNNLVKVFSRPYVMSIEIWPDDWASSPGHCRVGLQISFPKTSRKP